MGDYLVETGDWRLDASLSDLCLLVRKQREHTSLPLVTRCSAPR